MQSQTRVFVTLSVIIVLIGGLYLFSDWFSKATGYVLGEDQKVAFATCLVSHRVTLYETPDCLPCEEQRKLLGEEAYAVLPKQICDRESLCGGLSQVPAWEIEGSFYYGVRTFEQLDTISSCELKSAS